ncbi:hypothetical protein M413DRAFT_184427 [Hebeloma cylindrosporum]|uniref:Uncharacterized protein n=1 Tax=Hebeloma cylindrosporum TaxID=76867 RepID=A0A0C3C6E5_HEBCY|nr:hypothetical protein M413DRAFT_184427 [Hebeloma cylindrosporum h7]
MDSETSALACDGFRSLACSINLKEPIIISVANGGAFNDLAISTQFTILLTLCRPDQTMQIFRFGTMGVLSVRIEFPRSLLSSVTLACTTGPVIILTKFGGYGIVNEMEESDDGARGAKLRSRHEKPSASAVLSDFYVCLPKRNGYSLCTCLLLYRLEK